MNGNWNSVWLARPSGQKEMGIHVDHALQHNPYFSGSAVYAHTQDQWDDTDPGHGGYAVVNSGYQAYNPYCLSPVQELGTVIQEMIVPQRQYVANIQRNHTYTIPTIEFIVNGRKGISLRDALSHNFRGLLQADDRLLHGFGVKVTYRIEWPGYLSFNRQKHALRATREKESVTRAKLAVHVAEVMKDFIQEMAEASPTEPLGPWRVGPNHIALEHLYLLELHQVAKASLQPVIAYRNPGWRY